MGWDGWESNERRFQNWLLNTFCIVSVFLRAELFSASVGGLYVEKDCQVKGRPGTAMRHVKSDVWTFKSE